MDKTEYGIKLDQINSFVDKQDFQSALEVVETIEWRRVKSVRTLCMVGDIYEANGMLEESKDILLLAYNRTSAGKGILYRLVEISLKLHQIDEAVEYYTEYVKIARGDNTKYLLKYKIYRARSAPLGDQIAILEEYKAKEYTERWAYELARLYDKAGLTDKCIEECDDLALWFSEGKYVIKAMELKMNYTPLSPSQQEKYNNRHINSVETDISEEPQQAAAVSQQLAEYAVDIHSGYPETLRDSGTQEAAATSEDHMKTLDLTKEVGYTYDQPLRKDSENIQEKLANSFRDVFSGFSKMKEEIAFSFEKNHDVLEMETEESEDIETYNVVKDLEPENLESVQEGNRSGKLKETFFTPAAAPQESEPVAKAEVDDVDITKILEATANDLAEEVAQSQAAVEAPVEKETEEKMTIKPEESAVEETQLVEEEIEVDEEVKVDEEAETEEQLLEEEESSEEVPKVDLEAVRESDLPETDEEIIVEEAAEQGADGKEELSIEEKILREETPEEKRLRILKDSRPEVLTDEQKNLFTYFAKVPGVDQQLLDAIYGVYAHAGDKTSKHGNIAVMGDRGTGKTRLTEGLVKAICKDLGIEAVKVARLKGEELNQKDAAMVVAKLSGGFLIIEKAASMNQETIDKLSYAMEFRTDSLIVIIEDEKQKIRTLMKEQEGFAEKFETMISIPVFTNDELVSFAKTYAREMGYKIDDMAVLALYTLISENQTDRDPFTIARVKVFIDEAIQHAHKGTRRFGRKLSAREVDGEGLTILYEKDFN